MLAGPPYRDVVVPPRVQGLAGGDSVRCVWVNQLGGLTFEVGEGARRRFVKWVPIGTCIDLGQEASRLAWASAFTPVPRVIDCGHDRSGSWLVTLPLPGETAVSERWKGAPEAAATQIGQALRALHDALPVDSCRYAWSRSDRVRDARRRFALGAITPSRWHPEHRGLSTDEVLARLDDGPEIDRLVVCHGDACAPNTLLTADGRWSGHVDLGSLGVADRWADLAVATWSTQWNYGSGFEDCLLDGYGVEPDPARTAYYRLLWEVGP
jgi:kanamycin kinase